MAIKSRYRVGIFIVLLLGSSSVQANTFFRRLARQFTDRFLVHFYPWNILVPGYNALQQYRNEKKMVVDNTEIAKTYPRACTYVQEELKQAGIADYAHVRLMNVDELSQSATNARTLRIPLKLLESDFDKEVGWPQRATKGVITHEFGHLANNSVRNVALSRFLTYFVIEGVYRLLPIKMPPLWEQIVKNALSRVLINVYDHADEYRADRFVRRRFKDEPDTIASMGLRYLCRHYDEISFQKTPLCYGEDVCLAEQQANAYIFSPLKLTLLNWFIDTHATCFVRAHRFIKAAHGSSFLFKECPSRRILARELQRQYQEHPRTLDLPQIGTLFDNINAIELPDVFKTYWM